MGDERAPTTADHLRHARVHTERIVNARPATPPVDVRGLADSALESIDEALDALPDRYRTVVVDDWLLAIDTLLDAPKAGTHTMTIMGRAKRGAHDESSRLRSMVRAMNEADR